MSDQDAEVIGTEIVKVSLAADTAQALRELADRGERTLPGEIRLAIRRHLSEPRTEAA